MKLWVKQSLVALVLHTMSPISDHLLKNLADIVNAHLPRHPDLGNQSPTHMDWQE